MKDQPSTIGAEEGCTQTRAIGTTGGPRVFVLIHESLVSGFVLLRDPIEGYLYRGTIGRNISYRDGRKSHHNVLWLARPALYLRDGEPKTCVRTLVIRPRYSGDDLKDLPSLGTITVNFSFSARLNLEDDCSESDGIMMDEIDQEIFGIGIGEIQLDPPRKPFVEAPWEMTEYGGEKR